MLSDLPRDVLSTIVSNMAVPEDISALLMINKEMKNHRLNQDQFTISMWRSTNEKLWCACFHNDINAVTWILDRNIDFDQDEKDKCLHCACKEGHFGIVKL